MKSGKRKREDESGDRLHSSEQVSDYDSSSSSSSSEDEGVAVKKSKGAHWSEAEDQMLKRLKQGERSERSELGDDCEIISWTISAFMSE
jgi:hypothetical protein